MVDTEQFFDIFFIYHPDDIAVVRRIAAQLTALGSACRFDESEFSGGAVDTGLLKADVLRSHAVAIVLSPASAASQLCNELIQHAVTNSKRIVSLILEEDIDVEVHPAVADHPYVFFREQDHLADRVEEARQYMAVDYEVRLHTELLVAAERWQRRGRRPSQLLPPERVIEARQWLANDTLRTVKPSPLLVEYIHSSRRQRAPSRPAIPFARLSLALLVAILLGAVFVALRAALDANAAAQAAAAQTSAARARLALTAAAATAASDSAVGLVDLLAATSERIADSVNRTAQAEAAAATKAAYATTTVEAFATRARATEVYQLARDADANRLVRSAETALAAGDSELALALAWTAKDALEDPKPAYRVLRRAEASGGRLNLDDVALLAFEPHGAGFTIVPRSADKLQIYDGESWTLQREIAAGDAPITVLAYSRDGRLLASGAATGEVVIRAAQSGAAIHRLQRHQTAVTALAFDPAGDRLYSAGADPLLVAWDSERGEELAFLATQAEDALTISELLATAEGGRIIATTAAGGQAQINQFTADALEPVAYNAGARDYRGFDAGAGVGYSGGRSLPAYPNDPHTGDLTLWNLATGAPIATVTEGFNWSPLGSDLTAVTDELLFIALHGDLALLAVRASDGGQRAALIRTSDGSLVRSFEDELAASLATADFLDPTTLLSATYDQRLILWSSADGSILRELGAAPQSLTQVELSADGSAVVARAADGSALLWRLNQRRAEPTAAYSGALPGTALSPSGRTLLLATENGATLRDIDADEIISRYDARLVSSAGANFALALGNRVKIHEIETGDELRAWPVDWVAAQAMHLSPEGKLLLAQADGALWLLRAESDSPTRLTNGGGPPLHVAFAAGGANFATLHAERAILWDAVSGEALGAYPLGDVSADQLDLVFSPDGATLHFFLRQESGPAGLTSIAIADNAVRRYTYLDVDYGELSPDGQFLLLALRTGALRIVGAATGQILHTLPLGASGIQSLRLLPQHGLLLASSGAGLTVWDTAAAALDQQFVQTKPVASYSHSADAQRYLTIDDSGGARLWQVESPAALLRRIETQHPPRELTCAEREQYHVLPLCEQTP